MAESRAAIELALGNGAEDVLRKIPRWRQEELEYLRTPSSIATTHVLAREYVRELKQLEFLR